MTDTHPALLHDAYLAHMPCTRALLIHLRPPSPRPLPRVKNHVQRNGIRQAVVSMSLAGPRGAALNDAIADLTNVSNCVLVLILLSHDCWGAG